MAQINDVIEQQRRRLRRREREAIRDLVNAYIDVERLLWQLILQLAEEIANDPSPTIGKVFRYRRYQALYRQVREQIGNYATNTVGPVVERYRRLAAFQGVEDIEELILAVLGPIPEGVNISAVFDRLDTQAIETLLASTARGPVADILATFGDEAAERIRQTLVNGMALGWNPNKIASELKRSLGVNLTRANLIARTEIHRAHRESSRLGYLRHQHIIEGWVWHAACDERTCVTCWAMHGTEFDLDTPMGAHPACRCAIILKTKTWKDLGFDNVPETSFETPSGSDLFRNASPQTQKAVLGPRAYEAYRNGEVDIIDFVKVKTSPRWGTTYTKGSLAHAKMNHGS